MSETEKVSIVSRIIKLNELVLGKLKGSKLNYHAVSRDGLLDALFALYAECNTPHLKKDPHVVTFIEKFQNLIVKLQNLRVNISDFEVKKIIGRGHFGEVQVVREKATGDVYAMKILHKAETLAQQYAAFYEEERDIMAKATSPWITKLQYAFQDDQNLYLVMEFHAGGDMLSLLEKCTVLHENMARFYIAELILGINSVHTMGYVHRDIKPDNILIDITGHIKLADFGSSAKLNSSKLVVSKMPVGTPDYIAPEVLVSLNSVINEKSSYSVECDWWSLGIVAYEMLYGVTPFANEKLLVVYNNIMNFKESLKFPDESAENSEAFLDLMKSLLSEAKLRPGYDELINHPLFSDVDWNNIRQTIPPFVPVVSGQDDTSNFDDFDHDMRPLISNFSSKTEFSARNLPFIGFSYTTPFVDNLERLSSLDNSLNSPGRSETDSSLRKKDMGEMQKIINELRASEEKFRTENQKLSEFLMKREKKIDKYESEIYRLENEISVLQANKKELKRLLQLEREDRVLTEKKAAQILKCMKQKKKRGLSPNIIIECDENEADADVKILDRLDDAFIDYDSVTKSARPYLRTMDRSKSLSPHCSKKDSVKLVQEFADLEKENKLLKEEMTKAKEERERLITAMKTFHDDHFDLEQELTVVAKERDEALAKIEEFKKRVMTLELKVFDLEGEGTSTSSSDSSMNTFINSMQKEVDIKNTTIFDLKTQLIQMREKRSEIEKQIKKHHEEFQGLVDSKDEVEKKLREELQKGVAQSVQIADLKKTIETLRKDLIQTRSSLNDLKKQEPLAKEAALDRNRREEEKTKDNLRLNLRINELEKEVESFRDALKIKQKEIEFFKKTVKEPVDTGSNTSTSSFHTARMTPVDNSSYSDAHNASVEAINIAEQKLNGKISTLREENDVLTDKISQLETKINLLSNNDKVEEVKSNLAKQLKEKESQISDLKLDFRILTREKNQADELLSILRNSNRTLKEKLAEAEKTILEKTKLETEMTDKIDILEKEVMWKKRDIDEKIKMYETQKDINKVFVKTQDQIQQITKEKEKLEVDSSVKECEKSQISSKLATLEKELQTKTEECNKLDELTKKLRSACTDLEEQLEDYDDLVKSHENDLKKMNGEISKLKQKILSLEADLKHISAEYAKEKATRENYEKQVTKLEEDFESQQAIYETEMHSLQEFIDHQKNVISDLEGQMTQVEQKCTTYNVDMSTYERKMETLEEELIQVKEEASKYITQISSLKASNFSLTQELEQMIENQREAECAFDKLMRDLQTSEASFNYERVKLQEQLSQQTKLIDFLQAKTESADKKKKTLNLPRLFGKKEYIVTTTIQRNDIEGLEKDKAKCRRLQDQLSQANAELHTLRKQGLPKTPVMERSKSTKQPIPVSPVSRAMHLALTASPTISNDLEGISVTRKKMQGMTHRIPHRFTEIICMRSIKCVACLDSIHFGRRAAKCQECSAHCHTKCAFSLPKTCGLPSEFYEHFEGAVNRSPSSRASSDDQSISEPKGWVKIPKASKQGWDKRFLRIIGSTLYFFNREDEEDTAKAVDSMDFAVANGDIVVISAVSATELTSVAKSDLPYVLKVEFRPSTTCWPPRTLYIMTMSFVEKQQWVETLESLANSHKVEGPENPENKLSALRVLKLKGDDCLDVLCTFILRNNTLLLGAVEGLFVVSLTTPYSGVLKYKIDGIDRVHQIACVDNINRVILITGSHRNLSIMHLDNLKSWIEEGNLRPIELNLIDNISGCHLFAAQKDNCDSPCLCSATENSVKLYQWDRSLGAFVTKQTIETQEPCSCIHFTKYNVILGCDKFFEVNLRTFEVREFLDSRDSSLACVIYGTTQFQSFPISIFYVSPDNEPEEEYLVCFHELGVFVDGYGQRTRQEDMRWSRLPLAFAYCSPYLFMTHFNSVEVIEILPREISANEKGIRAVINIVNPQYLGPAVGSGAIYISSTQNQTVEILCIDGDSAKPKNGETVTDESCNIQYDESPLTSYHEENSPGSEVPSREGKDSDGDGLDFSFTNSLLQTLDSGDNLSVTSSEDN